MRVSTTAEQRCKVAFGWRGAFEQENWTRQRFCLCRNVTVLCVESERSGVSAGRTTSQHQTSVDLNGAQQERNRQSCLFDLALFDAQSLSLWQYLPLLAFAAAAAAALLFPVTACWYSS
jgi:hypothetical protein